MAGSTLIFRLLGVDAGASEAIAKVGAAAELASLKGASAAEKQAAAQAKIGKAFNAVGKVAAVVTVGVIAEGAKMATQFEQSMTRLSTQAGVPVQQVKALSDQVLKLAPQVGIGPDQLAQALYHVESAFQSTGISGQQAMDILKTASEGAKVGGADLVDTTNALDAAIVSGIPGVQNYQQAMGALNKIVGTGDMTMQNLAEAFGTGAVAVVKNYGLSLTDVGAALAVFGDNNLRGADAATAMRMAVQSLAVPAKGGLDALKSIGLQSDTLAKDMQHGGLNQAMIDLTNHMTQAGITGNQTGQFLTEVFGKKAGVGLGILVSQFPRLESKYHDITAAAGSFGDAWKQQTETTKQKMDDLKAAWDVFLIEVGQKVLPVLKKVADYVSQHPRLIKDAANAVGILAAAWAAVKVGNLVRDLFSLSRAILGIGAASTTAASETAAANLGGAVGAGAAGAEAGAAGAAEAEAGAAGAAGASRLSALKFNPVKLIIPAVITYAILDNIGATKVIKDWVQGNWQKSLNDMPGWAKAVGARTSQISGSIGAGDPLLAGQDKYQAALDDQHAKMLALIGANARATSLNIADLSKNYGLNRTQASALYDVNRSYADALQGFTADLSKSTLTVQGNSAAAQQNRTDLGLAVQAVEAHSSAVLKQTGNVADANGTLQAGIQTILNNAAALGYNRQEVLNYIAAQLGVKPDVITNFQAPGLAEANVEAAQLLAYLDTLNGKTAIAYVQTVNLGQTAADGGTNNFASHFGYTGVPVDGQPHAMGGVASGWSLVGEQGPELIHVGSPSAVIPHGQTMNALGGGDQYTFNISTVDARSTRDWLQREGAALIVEAIDRRRRP